MTSMNSEHHSFSHLTIDDQATEEFFTSKQGGERGSNVLRVAHDETGNSYLLKSPIYFRKPESGQILTRQQFIEEQYPDLDINIDPKEFLQAMEVPLHHAERGQKLATYLGVPAPEVKVVDLDDTPYLAMEMLEGAEDRAFGSEIDFTDSRQAEDLALGAIFKVFVDAPPDDGQYLQTPDGNLYLTDFRLVDSFRDLQPDASDIEEQISSSAYFAPEPEIITKQVYALTSERAQRAITKIENLDFEELQHLFPNEDPELLDRLLQRREGVITFLKEVIEDPAKAVRNIYDLQKL